VSKVRAVSLSNFLPKNTPKLQEVRRQTEYDHRKNSDPMVKMKFGGCVRFDTSKLQTNA
jgi:hypothetical protein